jgi:hypothetical protein
MTSLMVPFRTFSFLHFLADLLQKSISVASNLFACCVFSVHVSAPYSKILRTKARRVYLDFLFSSETIYFYFIVSVTVYSRTNTTTTVAYLATVRLYWWETVCNTASVQHYFNTVAISAALHKYILTYSRFLFTIELYCTPKCQHATVKHSQQLFEHVSTSNLTVSEH